MCGQQLPSVGGWVGGCTQVGVLLTFAVVAAMITISRLTVADLIEDQLFMDVAGAMLEQTVQMTLDMRKLATFAHSRERGLFTTTARAAETNIDDLRTHYGRAFFSGPKAPEVLALWSSREVVMEWNVSAAATVRMNVSMWDAALNIATAAKNACAFEFEALLEVGACARCKAACAR